MRRALRAVPLLVVAVALGGCERERPKRRASKEEPEASPTAAVPPLSGSVRGRALTPKRAVFLWRDKANDMALVFSDAENLCEALTAGKWPRGATILHATLKHNAHEDRDAPFGAGEFPLRAGGAKRPQDTKGARFLGLDDACSFVVSEEATSGWVRLSTPRVSIGGTAEGVLDLTLKGGDRLQGSFSATHCKAEEEPRGCL